MRIRDWPAPSVRARNCWRSGRRTLCPTPNCSRAARQRLTRGRDAIDLRAPTCSPNHRSLRDCFWRRRRSGAACAGLGLGRRAAALLMAAGTRAPALREAVRAGPALLESPAATRAIPDRPAARPALRGLLLPAPRQPPPADRLRGAVPRHHRRRQRPSARSRPPGARTQCRGRHPGPQPPLRRRRTQPGGRTHHAPPARGAGARRYQGARSFDRGGARHDVVRGAGAALVLMAGKARSPMLCDDEWCFAENAMNPSMGAPRRHPWRLRFRRSTTRPRPARRRRTFPALQTRAAPVPLQRLSPVPKASLGCEREDRAPPLLRRASARADGWGRGCAVCSGFSKPCAPWMAHRSLQGRIHGVFENPERAARHLPWHSVCALAPPQLNPAPSSGMFAALSTSPHGRVDL